MESKGSLAVPLEINCTVFLNQLANRQDGKEYWGILESKIEVGAIMVCVHDVGLSPVGDLTSARRKIVDSASLG